MFNKNKSIHLGFKSKQLNNELYDNFVEKFCIYFVYV